MVGKTGKTGSKVARIVVDGQTYCSGQLTNYKEARQMLSEAFKSNKWPDGRATVTITPGGFIRTKLPRDYDGGRGWPSAREGSKPGDLNKLKPYAKAAVDKVLSVNILKKAKRRTRFLTLGVDLNHGRQKKGEHTCGTRCLKTCTHAELVAVVDTNSGKVIRWTGKSYPIESQQHTLVHVVNLKTHFLIRGSEHVLILGCHDLHFFSDRGGKSKDGDTPKEKRSKKMFELAKKFKPTMILHHPHTTYSSRVWSSAWGAKKLKKLKIQTWASGIAFCHYSKAWKPDQTPNQTPNQTLKAVRKATASGGVHNVVVEGWPRE